MLDQVGGEENPLSFLHHGDDFLLEECDVLRGRFWDPLAQAAASVMVFCIYPCFTALISFWFFGFEHPDVYGLLDWIFCLALPAFAGSLWGFSFGTFFKSEATALQANIIFILMFNLGAGHTTNLGKGANYFATFIATISPVRYGAEMLMYRILKGSTAEQFVLHNLGYTSGNQTCILALLLFSVLCFLVGWLNLIRANRFD